MKQGMLRRWVIGFGWVISVALFSGCGQEVAARGLLSQENVEVEAPSTFIEAMLVPTQEAVVISGRVCDKTACEVEATFLNVGNDNAGGLSYSCNYDSQFFGSADNFPYANQLDPAQTTTVRCRFYRLNDVPLPAGPLGSIAMSYIRNSKGELGKASVELVKYDKCLSDCGD